MYSDNDRLFKISEDSILDLAKGAFAKRVAVIVLSEADCPENTTFLRKILLAAGLDLEKDTLFAEFAENDQRSFLPLANAKQAESILVFGISPKQLGLNLNCPPYTIINFYGLRFLFTDKLSTLESDNSRKAKLWQALQQLYLASA